MFRSVKIALTLIVATIFLGISCNIGPDPGTLKVNLIQKVGETPLVMNEWLYTSPAGHLYKLRRLQLLVSDFVLHNADGSTIEFDMKHFYQFDREDTKNFTLIDIPAATYDKISFVFGLDEEKNQDNAYPDDYDMINFKWPSPLGQGYHYMRFEVTSDSMASGVTKDFNLHTGATHGNQNYLRITLDLDEFTIDDNNFEMDLIMDMNEWLQNPLIYDFEDFGHGIMGNQSAQDILKANGYSAFSSQGPLEILY